MTWIKIKPEDSSWCHYYSLQYVYLCLILRAEAPHSSFGVDLIVLHLLFWGRTKNKQKNTTNLLMYNIANDPDKHYFNKAPLEK